MTISSPPDNRTSRHRGFTLIEMVTVMGVTALIAVIATSVLLAMLQQQSAMRAQLQVGISQTRLAEKFRVDVQGANSAELKKDVMLLSGPRGDVTYERLPPDTIRRARLVDGTPRFDDFLAQAHHEVRFAVEDLGKRIVVTLVVLAPSTDASTSDQSPHTVSPRGMTVVAELGRDQRWGQPEESE